MEQKNQIKGPQWDESIFVTKKEGSHDLPKVEKNSASIVKRNGLEILETRDENYYENAHLE